MARVEVAGYNPLLMCRFGFLLASLLVVGCQGAAGVKGAPVEDAGVDAKKAPPAVVVDEAHVVGPARLSETGLYEDFAKRKVRGDVISFVPRFPLWSDGAEKKRYLALPEGGTIDTSDMDAWGFPLGTKMWKEFWVGQKLVETRLLSRESEDEWWMVSYLWREDGSDADAVVDGMENALGTQHDVPSQNDCRKCHAGGHSLALGVTAVQLTGDMIGKLSGRMTAPPAGEFVVPGGDVERAALGYLHANCGHCHNDHTGLHSQSAMRLALRAKDSDLLQTPVYKTAFGLKARHVVPPAIDTVIVPGQPEQSQLFVRMALRAGWAMPPIATEVGDPDGVDAVYAWISALQ